MGTRNYFVAFGAVDDDYLLGVIVAKLGIEDTFRRMAKTVFKRPDRVRLLKQGMQDARALTLEDVGAELARMEAENEFALRVATVKARRARWGEVQRAARNPSPERMPAWMGTLLDAISRREDSNRTEYTTTEA